MRKTIPHKNSLTLLSLLSHSRQTFRLIAAFFLALPLLASATVAPGKEGFAGSENAISITVAPGNWGTAHLDDIQRVLESVADSLHDQVAHATASRLNIRVIPRSGSPRVLYQRGPNGEYVVHLTARDERWFQYAYQFSHELCHIFSNFDHKATKDDVAVTDNQWFEETLCETASLSTLKHLAKTWADAPPARKWIGYAPTFARYADYLMASEHRHLPAGHSLSQWYGENQAALRQSPYLREKNELAANTLLPLFDKTPGNWRAIVYLNPDKQSATLAFNDYLTAWYAACPTEQKELVRQTMALFGLSPTATQQLALASRFLQSQPPDK